MSRQPNPNASTPAAGLPRRAARCGHLDARRHLRRHERGLDDGDRQSRRRTPFHGRDRRRTGRTVAARQRRAHRRAAFDRGHRRVRHPHRPVSAAETRRMGDRPLPAFGRLGQAHARWRRAAVLGLLGRLSAGGDGALRRQGRDRPFRLCEASSPTLSRRPDPPRARAGDLRPARGTGQLGRVEHLARHGPLPHRPPCRRHGRAGGRAHVRAAMASGRAGALHDLRGQERPRRRRDHRVRRNGWRPISRSPIRSRR